MVDPSDTAQSLEGGGRTRSTSQLGHELQYGRRAILVGSTHEGGPHLDRADYRDRANSRQVRRGENMLFDQFVSARKERMREVEA